ncbi:mannose-1-phosphate guanylyltransferase/mannose-6-phosphate isomerase [Caminibacter pacificus]|uniref:mannose-1-phosphate guanylyltransferase n=1 Tax=Caminibacter pacificus TaxID=1424653 RepID=A0AAJ4UXV5_9BACT|nr:mannose-1-phosphate guanylyltransferase/mannose-6-phosphate isomerase [Caminibacter pacificus]QCI27757.1 mannose-1-phosphate guanylyltransferase/mannose-6-phosphate isomerase [Caminibacter pacificus]ROR40068.1 mannose-1-phosphate guanylyltransferase [Caminibacter pacificus]
MTNVILCGGSGTRLWPVSRENLPKQFLKMFDGKSLFQLTVERNRKYSNKFVLVSNENQYFMALDQLDEIKLEDYISIIEPIGRNTAASIAFAAFSVDEEEVLFVTPSDHLIKDDEHYEKAIKAAYEEAKKGYLITFGITPNAPKTGYGYIKVKNCNNDICDVESFKEKPDEKTAKKYLEEGNYYWNSGMFMFKAGVYLNELKKYAPDIYEAVKNACKHIKKRDFMRIKKEDMLEIRDESIDYAVMEHSKKIKMVKSDIDWKDVGDFDALYEVLPKDENGNTKNEKLLALNSKNNLVFGRYKKQIAINDIDDMIIVDTPTALLVTKRGNGQKVKDIVKVLKKINPEVVKFGRTVYRPWGKYINLEDAPNFKVKIITVNPGKRLSLQKHFHRSEHWVVVSGIAEVTIGDKTFLLRPNESTYIPIGEIHRLANPGKIPLEIIEVQVGEYLSEDDIVRIEDDYGRI